MDLHDIWQENKRWILGVVLGLMVFWIGDAVVAGMYDQGSAQQQIRRQKNQLQDEPKYDREALVAVREESAEIAAVRAKLEQSLVFTPSEEFRAAGRDDPDLHYDEVSRRVKDGLLRRANALGIELAERNLDLPSPSAEQIDAALVGLCLLDHAGTRLFEAHEAALRGAPDARGVIGIDALQIVDAAKRTVRRGAADEVVREQKLRLRMRVDHAALQVFLESCASVSPPISLAPDFEVTTGAQRGDPLLVKMTLLALSLP